MLKIEVGIIRDGFLSQHYFDESMKRIEGDLWQYIDYGNIEEQTTRQLVHINRNSSKSALASALGENISWYEGWSRDELIDELYDQAGDLKTLLEWLNDSPVKYKKLYDKYTTRGYSQGDYATVIVPHKAIEGWKIDQPGMQKHIDNLFWDQPITGTVMVNNDEHFISDMLEDTYEWDIDKVKDQIIAYIDKHYANVPAKQAIHDRLSDCLELISEIEYAY